MAGPLAGLTVTELAGIGPGPFAAMMLGDMGAEVIRVHRASSAERGTDPGDVPVIDRNRRSIGVDLKHPRGVDVVLALVEQSDVLIEGFRPGVAERLGVGPDPCLKRNPRLIYGRVTGWGQEGPLSHAAGHDLNYIALAGALAHFGRKGQKPTPPINLVGDFAGGGMLLSFGVVCAVLEARSSGAGQVVDAAIVDGAAALMAMHWGLRSLGGWNEERGTNVGDTGAPHYDTYECADGAFVSVAALEPQFYAELVSRLGADFENLDPTDPSHWSAIRSKLDAVFRTKTRGEWCELLEGTDSCFAPVLTMSEAAAHPQIRDRGTIVEVGGVEQPAPAPRFSRTHPTLARPAPRPGEHTDEVLAERGWSAAAIADLRAAGAIG